MPPAVIGGAIAGVGAIGSAVIGSSAAKSAANASSQAAQAAAAEQRAARDKAYNTLQPYIQAGVPATNTINALLGLGGSAGTPGLPDYAAYVRANPDLATDFQKVAAKFNNDPEAYGQYHWNKYGQFEAGRSMPTTGGTAATSAQDAQSAATQAFDQYKNSTGYQFRVNEGMRAVNSGYAGAGTIKSGAAIKAASDHGQGMATQEFGNYLNALGNQQSLGYQAGSSAAGVGTQSANSLGSIYMQNGANQANAALAGAQNTANALNSITSIGANIFGKKA